MQIKKTNYKQPPRVWVCNEHTQEESEAIKEIAKELGIRTVTAGLIYDRIGKGDAIDASNFIKGDADYHDPFLLADMEPACNRICKAIKSGEKVTVYGDYDVDGVTSVSMLVTYLKSCGLADCEYYIPKRTGEGYGLSNVTIDKVRANGSTLMVTVDTGVTAIEEIKYARECGIDTVVTDHHECSRTNEAVMVLPDVPCVDPKRDDCTYPFKELAGVGVAFKLICALEMRLTGADVKRASKRIAYEYSELVAIGTVADVMPLIDENRTIVRHGLESMRSPRFLGTRELISLCAGIDYNAEYVKKLTASLISYTLAPRINAVGRMGDAAEAVKLFISEDAEEAADRALALCQMNAVRQQEENSILNEALAKIESADAQDKVIVLDDDSWHHGVVGIVASRISEKYGLPCILISFEGNSGDKHDEHDIGKGSGRSVKGLDLVKALEASRDTLLKFGGHELAAGLTLERGKLEEFKRVINKYAEEVMDHTQTEQKLEADAYITIDELDTELVRELYLLEPYGQANPSPRFILNGLKIEEIYPLKEGKHIKLVLSSGDYRITALWFGMKYSDIEFSVGDTIDVYGGAELNEFMGKTTVQLHIRDVRASKEAEEKLAADLSLYKAALHGGEMPADMIPDREDFAAVYRYLKANDREDGLYSYGVICAHVLPKQKLEYIKLRAVLDIMCELSLINYFAYDAKQCRIELNRQSPKVDLESSELLAAFRRRAKK